MQGRSGNVKVVWSEGVETHSAKAFNYADEDGFLKFDLFDGRVLRLSKRCILKIEEVRA